MSQIAPASAGLSDAQRFDWLRLWRSENIGPRTFYALIARFGSARAALEALPRLMPRGRPCKIANVAQIERELEAAARCGAVFVAHGEPAYPELLKKIDSAPPLVALRGNLSVFNRPAVAIVGSRNASAAGLTLAERLARGLAEAGFAIVSGLARGIDLRAHQASRETGTIAVLAGGQDRIYPPAHAAALEPLLAQGAAISEMPFGWEARARDFPRRNRIISGLAQGVIIVEAARRSGSLITARFAAEQGREVFAIPGSPLDPRAEGTNHLLREGATFCTSAQDVVDVLRNQIANLPPRRDLFSGDASIGALEEPLWDEFDLPTDITRPRGSDSPDASAESQPCEKPQEHLVALLGPTPVSIDELARAANLSMRETRAILLELELAGRLARTGVNLVSLTEA